MVSRAPLGEQYGKLWATNVMSMMASNLSLFYSIIFAELTYTRVQRGITRATALELEIGKRAVRHASHEISDPNRATLDSNLWSVVILGYSGKEAPLRTGSEYPRQSSLRQLQSLHIYCKMEIVFEHVFGLIKMVEVLGGLQKITTPGMAQLIS